MSALYSINEIREIERTAMACLPPGTLMQRAGRAAASAALKLLPSSAPGFNILVLAGPGNNGGDALEAAALLAKAGMNISVALFSESDKQPEDARQALERAKSEPVRFLQSPTVAKITASHWALVIDGLFGIGLTRPVPDALRGVIACINALACPILALDIPSGLNADTGSAIGMQDGVIKATHTVTFIGDKPGLHTCDGRDHAGDVQVDSLDIDARHFMPSRMRLNETVLFAHALQQRRHNTHKGSYGDIVLVGGARGMAGALMLAARAAAKCGAGRVFAAFIDEPPAYDALQPELMCRHATEIELNSMPLIVGPGLGMSTAAHDFLAMAIGSTGPLGLDADALNLVARSPELQAGIAQRAAATLLTPHPLEAARLLDVSSAEVQSDRISAAHALSAKFNAVTVLKGSGTVISNRNGDVAINPTGNPALATAGTGDVLSGMAGGLLAQNWAAWEAALAASWIHGYAADQLVERGVGPIGFTASELIPEARRILNQLTKEWANKT